MTKEDLELIKSYQAWRGGAEIPMPNQNEVRVALDRMIAYCEMCLKLDEDAENLLP